MTPQFTPWRAIQSEHGDWEVWTRLDPAPGSLNNYSIASGIQSEQEARLLASVPELAEALRQAYRAMGKAVLFESKLAFWAKGGDGYEAMRNAHATLARIEGRGEA